MLFRSVKLVMEDIEKPEGIRAELDGIPVLDIEYFCTDPRPKRFEVNGRIPDSVPPGGHYLEVSVGRRRLAPIPVAISAK